jgi:hypothetical protein
VVAVSGPQPGHGAVAVDGERWREAAQLRHDHVGWAVIWLAEAGEFRAYRRLPGARRDTALSAKTASDLAAQIEQAEQSARAADACDRCRADRCGSGCVPERGVLDVTATLDRPGTRASEVIVDEDGYFELRYWNQPSATPEQITTVVVRALAAIAAARRA